MGRYRCDVRGCHSHAKTMPGVAVHMFPRPPERALVWLRFCDNPALEKVPVKQLKQKASVCRKHFANTQFRTTACEKLNFNAVPSLFPPPPLTELNLPSTSDQQSPHTPAPVSTESAVFSSARTEERSQTEHELQVSMCVPCMPGPHTAEEWRRVCENPRLASIPASKLHNAYTVCGKHFATHQFTNSLMNRLNLNAVPSLYLPSSDVGVPLDDTAELLLTVLSEGSENDANVPIVNDVGNHFDDSNGQSSDVIGDDNSMSFNSPPSAPATSSGKGSGISLPEHVMSERTKPLLSQYYRYTLCRLCFSSSDHLTNIFEEGEECRFLISDAIEDLLQFKVSKTDHLPQFICSSCRLKLCQFKEFKESLIKMKEEFENSLSHLRKGVSMDENIQEELAIEKKSLMVKESEKSKDHNGIEPLCVLNENAEEDFSADYEEVLSDVEEPFSDFENMEGQDLTEPEAGDKISYVKEVSLEEEYKCSECGEVFQFKNLLTKHILEHRKTWPFPCRYCDKRFKTLLHLNCHIVRHSSYKPYECEHCGLRVRLKSSLAAHKKTHSNEKPFLCYVCGMVFRNRSLLTIHLRIHSGINCYKCEECGAEFPSSKGLARHLSTHSSNKNHVCGDCGKSFRRSRSLSEHIARVHQMERNYQCGVCSKKFSVKRTLSEHMKTHFNRMVPSDSILILT